MKISGSSVRCLIFSSLLFSWLQAGCLLGCGIVNSGVRNECDPALALLSDYVMHTNQIIRIGSILGYAVQIQLPSTRIVSPFVLY